MRRSRAAGASSGWRVSGFVARGLIYGIIGILAIKLAVGVGGTTTNQQGALKTIAHQPFGKVLLILVAIGLGGYALWRLVHALLGHGPEDSDSGFERLAAFGSGIVYAGLCAIAVEILLGSGSSGGSGNTRARPPVCWAGPAVPGWSGSAGAVLIGIGLYQGYRGLSKDFLKDSKTEQMSPRVRNWIEWIGSFGHLARMVVFGLVGVFLIKAAIDLQPEQGGRSRRCAGEDRPCLLRSVPARDRRRRPDRLRRLLAQRRPLPPHLAASRR